jgi:hypothetical protein
LYGGKNGKYRGRHPVSKSARRGREPKLSRPGFGLKRLEYSHVLCYPYRLLDGRSITLVPLPGNLPVDRCTKVQSFPLPCQKLSQSLFRCLASVFRPVTIVTTSSPYCTSHRFVQQIMRVRGFGWFAMPHLSHRDASLEPKKAA